VPSIRFRLDDPSIDALTARVRSEFGDEARIVSASEVRLGGIGGFFARRFVDVVVDVAPPTVAMTTPTRSGPVGLEALLEAAERAEYNGTPPTSAPVIPSVSTQSEDFERLMADLRTYSEPTPVAPAIVELPAPPLHDEPGGLVTFVGLGSDALLVARSLARSVRWSDVRVGGHLIDDGFQRVDDRRGASAFRARGVEVGAVGLLAWGAGMGVSGVAATITALQALNSDQLWVVVDASRKSEDTAAWVGALRQSLPVQAIAVVHGAHTATPDSVHALGLPVGWSDTVG
jgi:hypothetical protein